MTSSADKLRALSFSLLLICSVFTGVQLTTTAEGKTTSGGTASLSAAGNAGTIVINDATINTSSDSSIEIAYNGTGLNPTDVLITNSTSGFTVLDATPVTNSKGVVNLTIPAGAMNNDFTIKAFLFNNSGSVDTDTASITVNTPNTGYLNGTVTDSNGNPITGATVNISPNGNLISYVKKSATTDASGNYSIQLTAANYDVNVTKSGYRFNKTTNVTVSAGSTTDFDVQLSKPGYINGTVTDTSGNAISGATVKVKKNGSFFPLKSTTTDTNGNYSVQLKSGNYDVTVKASGYVQNTTNNVSVTSGSTTVVDVQLEQGGFINGTVTNATGTPLSNAFIGVFNESTFKLVTKGSTNNKGQYSLTVKPGKYQIVADPQKYRHKFKTVTLPSKSTTVFANFTLKPTPKKGFINGTVVNANGTGVANVPIEAHSSDYQFYGNTKTDSNGNFSLSVPAATYTIRVGGKKIAPKTVENVNVSEKSTTQLSIQAPQPTYINGTVTKASGNVPQFAFVVADSGKTLQFSPVGPKGGYNLTVPQGTFTVSVFSPAGSATSQTVTTTPGNDADVSFTLRKTKIKSKSVTVTNGSQWVNTNKLELRADTRAGLLQVQLVDGSTYGSHLGKPDELETIGVNDTTSFRINLTVTNFTANSLLWGINDARWNASANSSVTNGTDITVRGSPVKLQATENGNARIGPIFNKAPSQIKWPTGRKDRATFGVNETVYFGIFDLGNVPGRIRNTLNGISVTTNAQAFTAPQVQNNSLQIWVGGPGTTTEGTQHTGFYQATIPDSQLAAWGVTNPVSELNALYKGDPANFTVTDTAGGARIRIDNITFSAGVIEVQATTNDLGVSSSDPGPETTLSPGETDANVTTATVTNNGASDQTLKFVKVNVTSVSGSVDADDITKITVVNRSDTSTVLGSDSSVNRSSGTADFGVKLDSTPTLAASSSYEITVLATMNDSVSGADGDTVRFDVRVGNTSNFFSAEATGDTKETISLGSTTENSFTRRNDKFNLNTSFTTDADAGVGVNESTIDLRLYNINTTELVEVVRNGQIVNGTNNGSSLSGKNASVDIDIALQEGDWDLRLTSTVKDDGGNQIPTGGAPDLDDSSEGEFSVDMGGAKLKVIPDDRNPLAGTPANVSIVAVDQFGHELIRNDSNVNVTAGNIRFTFSDPTNTTNNGQIQGDRTKDPAYSSYDFTGDGQPPIHFNKSGLPGKYNVTFGISYSQAGNLDITAQDFGGNLTASDQVSQKYTQSISGVDVFTADGRLVADNSDTETVYVQLVDSNGNPIQRAGETIDFGVTSGNKDAAGLTAQSSETGVNTNSSGIATVRYTATNSGHTIDVTAESTSTGTTYSDTASFDTVPGAVDPASSTLELNGQTGDPTTDPVVGSQHNLRVTLNDNQSNTIQGVAVTFAANDSAVSFASATGTTNSSGQYATTMTLPDDKGTFKINVTAKQFNESGTSDAVINISTDAKAAVNLSFGSDTRNVPAGSSTTVTVQAVDTFGNVNTSVTPDINLSTADPSVMTIKGGQSKVKQASNGEASFTVSANASSGSATLRATASGYTNISDTFSIGTSSQIAISFDSKLTTSSQSGTVTTTMMRAQLQDAKGNDLAIQGENVTFAVSSGTGAELDQRNSSTGFTVNTNSSGVASIQINATDTAGDTTFLAQAENYTASGTGTVTTTGQATTIMISPGANSTAPNTTVNVTVGYMDSSGRMVPRTTQLTLSSSLVDSFFTKSGTTTVQLSPSQGSNYTATTKLNSTAGGMANLTAIGGGVVGSASIEFTTANVTPASVSIADQRYTNRTKTVTVERYEFGDTGQSLAIWTVINGSPDTMISEIVTSPSSGSNITVNLTTPINSNTTVAAGIHADTGSPTVANLLVSDTAAITITDAPQSTDELEDQYATDGDDITGDLAGIQNAISDWATGDLADVDGDGTTLDEIQALITRWGGST